MEFVNKTEARVANWYSKLPHLPPNVRQWLGTNVWWITLIGVILAALAVVNIFFFGALAALFIVGVGGPIGAAIVGTGMLIALVAFAAVIVEGIIAAIAISPLKAKQKRGWSLLLLFIIVEIGFAVVAFVFTFDLASLIMNILWAAVAGYFLFEIRDQFSGAASVKAAKNAPKFLPPVDTKAKPDTKK